MSRAHLEDIQQTDQAVGTPLEAGQTGGDVDRTPLELGKGTLGDCTPVELRDGSSLELINGKLSQGNPLKREDGNPLELTDGT